MEKFPQVTVFNKFSSGSKHADGNYYKAAVVEYVPVNLTTVNATISANVGRYVDIIGACKQSVGFGKISKMRNHL